MIDPKAAARSRMWKLALNAGAFAGAALFVYGLYLVWRPLAPLVGGLIVTAACLFASYDLMRRGER